MSLLTENSSVKCVPNTTNCSLLNLCGKDNEVKYVLACLIQFFQIMKNIEINSNVFLRKQTLSVLPHGRYSYNLKLEV